MLLKQRHNGVFFLEDAVVFLQNKSVVMNIPAILLLPSLFL
jgi:hypothetical protein